MANPRYRLSQALFERACRVIPLGSQTFSKSHLSYPQGEAPLFLARGSGAHVWDVDGNEYVDLVNGLLPNLLGYDDPDVRQAVIEQLGRGVSLSLATEEEVRLAEKLVALIPCAEQVRFGKNGSDVTAGAVRLARAHTGRDRIAACGYHGWQDWYIGSTARHRGVPGAVRELTHSFPYNDLPALEALLNAHPDEFAAVILEPMSILEPQPGYLQGVKDLAARHGALLVFDEIITGFRFHLGGAQALFGVTPDLAAFGKGMGNGFPIAALVGRADVMRGMEEIFFSFTFGGESVSIAAALAVIDKLEREPVIETLWRRGAQIAGGLREQIAAAGLDPWLGLAGKPCWSVLQFRDAPGGDAWQAKTFLLQEMLARGVLTAGSHNICYAHSEADAGQVLSAYAEVLPMLAEGLRGATLAKLLRCAPMQPIFRVRG